ncbi:LPS O-antigen chain length determinant protein, WzzB/FepE family [Pseudomonas flavescens]|uniref:LPS O-antigen chain length determinant protein, WzzB/FepE family n=1 Tax=Phytopseudomonas flavescens TaxID=29435 RepID=A0A1G8L7H7_9GAMM|nr:Wzz/FepE/Etk N-terminal domain-containing protein [Pseudomonas flavescens]SDI51606.1 LPS O-antigen chain length determinant protein, WzzB/FepE family [Pseudomonas flavescens]
MSQAPNVRPQNDEIDLGELMRALWERKKLIIGVAAVVTLLAVAYALLATKYYRTQSILRPVAMNVLDELNASGLYTLTPEEALQRVGAGISSYEYRLEYFNANQELFGPDAMSDGQTAEQAMNQIIEDFEILRPDPNRPDGGFSYVGLAYTYPWGVKGADIVNGLIQYVIQQERTALAEDVEVIIRNRLAKLEQRMAAERAAYQADKQAKIASLSEADALKRAQLQDELNSLRKQLRTRRDDRIAQLNEAVMIAKSLGIEKPSTPSTLSDSAPVSGSGNVIRTEVNNQQIPLYFMGTEALEAERDALQKRRSDEFTEPRVAKLQADLRLLEQNREVELLKQRADEDVYIENYAKWNQEAAELKGLNLNLNALQLVNIDRQAIYPRSAIKPKRILVVALGAVLGTMLGLFIALMSVLTSKPKTHSRFSDAG